MGSDRRGRPRVGRYDREFPDLPSSQSFFDKIPTAGVDEHLFVVAEAVKEIKNGKAAGFVRVVAWREKDAIGNRVREDFGGKRITFDAAGSGKRKDWAE